MQEYLKNLKRDYKANPVPYGKTPDYEDLYYLYIDCNLTYEEIAPIFNVKACTIKSYVKKLNIVKSKELKVKTIQRKTFEKYGTTSYSKTKEYKQKIIDTSLSKYGTDSPNKNIDKINKTKKTCLERYGVDNIAKLDSTKEKQKETLKNKTPEQLAEKTRKQQQTNLEKYGHVCSVHGINQQKQARQTTLNKYGSLYAISNTNIKELRAQNNLEKWGTTNISTKHLGKDILDVLNNKEKLQEFINDCELKTIKHVAEKLGVSYTGLQKKLHELDMYNAVEHPETYAEIELKQILTNFIKTRQIIAPLELDFYNENLKLAVEFNGVYWHSEIFKDKHYHQQKSNFCKEKDIFLYHIFEHEWEDKRKKNIILSQLNNLIGKNTEKIMARKCSIKEITAQDSNLFLNENHLQGEDKASVRIGLFSEDRLVSLMTFCKPRFNKNFEWELSRFCNLQNTTVTGAASKLFKYFLTKYNPQNIISYSNYSKTKGTLYSILGFNLEQLSSPNYVWMKDGIVLSRYQCQKHKLEEFKDLGNTEVEIMHNRGFYRLFDCGNFVWSWTK